MTIIIPLQISVPTDRTVELVEKLMAASDDVKLAGLGKYTPISLPASPRFYLLSADLPDFPISTILLKEIFSSFSHSPLP